MWDSSKEMTSIFAKDALKDTNSTASLYNTRARRHGNFSLIDRMRGFESRSFDLDGDDISLAESYGDKYLDTRVMGGLYNVGLTDIYTDDRLFTTHFGLDTDGIIKTDSRVLNEENSPVGYSAIADGSTISSGNEGFGILDAKFESIHKKRDADELTSLSGPSTVGGGPRRSDAVRSRHRLAANDLSSLYKQSIEQSGQNAGGSVYEQRAENPQKMERNDEDVDIDNINADYEKLIKGENSFGGIGPKTEQPRSHSAAQGDPLLFSVSPPHQQSTPLWASSFSMFAGAAAVSAYGSGFANKNKNEGHIDLKEVYEEKKREELERELKKQLENKQANQEKDVPAEGLYKGAGVTEQKTEDDGLIRKYAQEEHSEMFFKKYTSQNDKSKSFFGFERKEEEKKQPNSNESKEHEEYCSEDSDMCMAAGSSKNEPHTEEPFNNENDDAPSTDGRTDRTIDQGAGSLQSQGDFSYILKGILEDVDRLPEDEIKRRIERIEKEIEKLESESATGEGGFDLASEGEGEKMYEALSVLKKAYVKKKMFG